ncbi:hypothetical protein [Mycolicibacterium sp. P1-5]|uniref:hypothetical protein n=1 Tax=Mycolicibacterium sp. P1-5 TaxID=2024617 RepID=UPI0011EE1F22|nr:hypothetical protein [Mycolicibacterium sp. P1-5]KAA0112066.1 hypothetical protein CIW47_02195 [Mycolicibacterium sp. P1-5]
MTKTASTKTTATITTVGAIKKFATAAAMMGALGLGALGAAGAAAAAPAHTPAPKPPASSEKAGPAAGHGDAEVHAHFIPGFTPSAPPVGQEPVIPTHFIPGFKPSPPPASTVPNSTESALGSALPPSPGYDPNHKDCEACEEVIDE